MALKDTQSWQNLNQAFNAESRVTVLYGLYAECAKAAGQVEAARLFEKTAENERAHAKVWFRQLFEACPEAVGNLLSAADGEHFEWTQMYNEYARQARQDGYEPLAQLFDKVATIERSHEQAYRAAADAIQNGTAHKRSQPVQWQCEVCGYIYDGMEAPLVCPVCGHPQGYYVEKPAQG